MTYTPITGAPTQYSTGDNELASGYYLKFYKANTSTPLSIATDATGGSLLAKIKLNDQGFPISNPLDNATVFIPHVSEDYRIVLYLTEADADADNTANAVWNVNPLSTVATFSTTADGVTVQGTTLQALADYDRSPIFVDGTDFTAGAPPHVITVPSGWNPIATTLRYWKKSSAGVIAALNASGTTSSTFTVNESLLSTDEVFIGDDTARNIHDGDPADIRDRLNVYSKAETYAKSEVYTKAEADTAFLDAANDLSDLADAATARTNLGVYSKTEVDNAFVGAFGTVSVVTGSRAFSTDYQNLTLAPMLVTVSATTGGNETISLLIDGAITGRSGSGSAGVAVYAQVNGMVPAGSTYRVNVVGAPTLDYWTEVS